MGSNQAVPSIVVLAQSPPVKSIYELQEAIRTLFPSENFHAVTDTEPEDDDGEQSFIVDGFPGPTGHPSYFIKSLVDDHSGIFLVHVAPQRYWTDNEVFQKYPETDPVKIIDSHKSWFSVDLLDAFDGKLSGLRFARRLAATIAPPDALGVFDPARSEVMIFTDQVKTDFLNGDDPYEKDAKR